MPTLVAELNKLYHEHEASRYDNTHPEIFEQLPGLWQEMISEFERLRGYDDIGADKLQILDFGCGTGFEARQCLERFGKHVKRLVCYDPSEPMVDRCRRTLAGWDQVEYITHLDQLSEYGGFNVLLTNSVLHHLLDPIAAIKDIDSLLSPDAVWLCGHEPSRRFVRNPQCNAVLNAYRAHDRWRRVLSPRRCTRRLLRWVGLAELPEEYAARRAFEKAIFERRPPAHLVSQLVDFHVITEKSEVEESKGLGKRSRIAIVSVLPLRLPRMTGTSPQNSQMSWRQAPQGAVSASVSATTAMASKPRSPSLIALRMATRSAQTVRP